MKTLMSVLPELRCVRSSTRDGDVPTRDRFEGHLLDWLISDKFMRASLIRESGGNGVLNSGRGKHT